MTNKIQRVVFKSFSAWKKERRVTLRHLKQFARQDRAMVKAEIKRLKEEIAKLRLKLLELPVKDEANFFSEEKYNAYVASAKKFAEENNLPCIMVKENESN